MKKIIATTTINAPTEAIRSYDAMPDWELLVVGDKRTPEYKLERGYYMGCDEQMDRYRDLCELIGWNSVRRGRMIAWIEAYKRGAEILASIDDDCYPHKHWGERVFVGASITACEFMYPGVCFNPRYNGWPRGWPLELMEEDICYGSDMGKIEPLIQQDDSDVQGDYDATLRIARVEGEILPRHHEPFFCDSLSPVNTQNTFLHRSIIKDFPANIPFIGRADDIWAGYICQTIHPRSTLYCSWSVNHEQKRSIQSLINDLEEEIFMYRNTYGFLQSLKNDGVHEAMKKFLPSKAIEAIDLYGSYFD